MKRWLCISLILLTGFLVFCNDFIRKDMEASITELEAGVYTMKDNVTVNEESLVKGQKIKVKVTWGKDWIRVRGFPADVDPLQVKQVLLLYLFQDEFTDKKFTMDSFMKEFNKIVQPLQKK